MITKKTIKVAGIIALVVIGVASLAFNLANIWQNYKASLMMAGGNNVLMKIVNEAEKGDVIINYLDDNKKPIQLILVKKQ